MKLISKIYKMYWAFYKSTVTINLVVSLMVSLVVLMISPVLASITVFAIGYVTFGLFFSFLYKEVVRPKEYYFYYNRGISKIKLIVFCILVNCLLSTLILIILNYVTSS